MFSIPEWVLTLTGWVQRASLQAALLVLLIFIVQWVLRDRLTPRWRYALWMIVLARLALPWTPSSPLSIFNLIHFNPPRPAMLPTPAQVADPAEMKIAAPPAKETAAKEKDLGSGLENLVFKNPPTPAVPPAGRPGLLEIGLQSSPLIWLAGAITLSLFILTQILLLSRFRGERVVTDQLTLELLEQCKRDMGIRTYLAVVQAPAVKTPALFGFLRPRLLLPPKTLQTCTLRELRHIFLHELAHLKRHDILVNWAMALLQILHWFNPLVWYAFYRIRIERELACDRLALSSMTENPKDYGQTIVHLLEQFSQPRALPSLAGILEDKKQITRRMTMIANFKKESRRLTVLAALVLLTLIGVGLTSATTTQPASTVRLVIPELGFTLDRYPEGGLYDLCAAVRNDGKDPVPFDVGFYINDPARKTPQTIGGGTVKPGEIFREGNQPFALKEGTNHLVALLDPNNKIPNLDRSADLAQIKVVVKNGKIVETQTTVSSSRQPLHVTENTPSMTIPDNMALVKIRLVEGISDGKPLPEQLFSLCRYEGTGEDRHVKSIVDNTRMKTRDGSIFLLDSETDYFISLNRFGFYGMKEFRVVGGREYDFTVVCPSEPKSQFPANEVTLNFKPKVEVKTEKDTFLIECVLAPLPFTLDLEGTYWKRQTLKGDFGFDGKSFYSSPRHRNKPTPYKPNVGQYRLVAINLLYNDTLKEPKRYQRESAYYTASQYEFPQDQGPLLDVMASGENRWTITLPEKIVSRIHQLSADKPRYSKSTDPKRALLDQAEALFQEGKSAPPAVREAKLSEALRAYSQIVDKYPDSKEYAGTARMMIGLCYDWMGKKNEAVKALEAAAKAAPTYSPATYYYLAACYQDTGRKTAAIQAYKQCVQLCEKQNNTGGFPCADARKALTALERK